MMSLFRTRGIGAVTAIEWLPALTVTCVQVQARPTSIDRLLARGSRSCFPSEPGGTTTLSLTELENGTQDGPLPQKSVFRRFGITLF